MTPDEQRRLGVVEANVSTIKEEIASLWTATSKLTEGQSLGRSERATLLSAITQVQSMQARMDARMDALSKRIYQAIDDK